MNIWKKQSEIKRISHEVLDMEISELNLSVRSYNCLKRAGCHTVGAILDLIAEDEGGLRKIRNLGNRSEAEILDCISRFQEEYPYKAETTENEQVKKEQEKIKILVKPAKKWWDTESKRNCTINMEMKNQVMVISFFFSRTLIFFFF